LHKECGPALPHWREAMFAAIPRNASHVTDYFRLPSGQAVEIGRQISI
jgi:KUP system potassium uptake protein